MIVIEIVAFAFATCATPGPVNILASLSGAKNGLRKNLPFVLGATSGLSIVIVIAGLGMGQILQKNKMLSNALIIVGSAYMLYLAFNIARTDVKLNTSQNNIKIPSLYQGMALQIINPKAWLVSMSGLAMYLSADDYLIHLSVYALIFFIVCFIAVFLWVYLGELIATKMNEKHLHVLNKTMGAVLFLLISLNLLDTFYPYFI